MSAPQNVIAVVFDFDDTLTDDSTTALIKSFGMDADDFWTKKAKALLDDGWGPTPAYLKLLLDNVGEGKPFGKLTNAALREFGKTLNFYPGLPEFFVDLQARMGEYKLSRPAIEFYIISGGLEEIIRGSQIAPYMSGIWGCEFAEDDGQIRYLKNIVSFTEKTKYLYQVNKGIGEKAGAYAVNKLVTPPNRRIPWENIIYVGDGLTDVPCFSLLTHWGGTAFGVFDPTKPASPKKAWESLVAPKRVTSMNEPKYGEKDALGALLRVAVSSIALGLEVKTKSALG